MKRKSYLYLIFCALIILGFVLVARDNKPYYFRDSRQIKPASAVNSISFRNLPQQSHFLIIKYLARGEVLPSILFNGNNLKTSSRKSGSGIILIISPVPKRIVSPENRLTVSFPVNETPKDLDITLTNARKVIGEGIYIYSRDFSIKYTLSPKYCSILILILVFCYFFPWWFFRKEQRILRLRLVPMFLFVIFLAIVFLAPLLTDFKIYFDKLYFLYAFSLTYIGLAVAISLVFGYKMFIANFRKSVLLLLLPLFSLLIVLLAAEALTRIYIHARYPASPFKTEDLMLSYSLRPSFKSIQENFEFTTNSLGFRNPEVSIVKPKGSYRIVCLGDSIAFGFGLKDGKTFPSQLQDILNKNSQSKGAYEVINCGVVAYNTAQERLFLERKVLKLQPDMVILAVCLNDMSAGINTPSIVNNLLNFDSYNYEMMRPLEKSEFILARKSYFAQYLILKFRMVARKYNLFKKQQVGEYGKKEIDMCKGLYSPASLELFKKEVLNIRDILKEKNIKFMLVIFPLKIQIYENGLDWPQRMMEEFCLSNKMAFFDLIGPLRGHKSKEIYLDTGHPNDYGSRLSAEYIAQKLF